VRFPFHFLFLVSFSFFFFLIFIGSSQAVVFSNSPPKGYHLPLTYLQPTLFFSTEVPNKSFPTLSSPRSCARKSPLLQFIRPPRNSDPFLFFVFFPPLIFLHCNPQALVSFRPLFRFWSKLYLPFCFFFSGFPPLQAFPFL